MKRKPLLLGLAAVGAIIAVFVILAVPRIVDSCTVSAVQGTMEAVAVASAVYRSEMGEWPTSLSNFTDNEQGITFLEWGDSGDLDPWGNPFFYMPYSDGAGCGLIVSWGADGKPGGKRQNRDRVKPFK